MSIPFEPTIGGVSINVHFILEYLAFIIAFRYYVLLRRKSNDHISSDNRLSIIIGAVFGAFFGSRLVGILEQPMLLSDLDHFFQLLNQKTIMGGLFGGLLGVELAKWIIKEKQSSGDLFTLPIIVGIFIGRIGCFLSGVNEFTYGKETSFVLGMDLGDGLNRHPIALYELFFLIILFFILKRVLAKQHLENGEVFKIFMLSYFGFRFFIEFLKPNIFFMLGLSTIQWLCILCYIYYWKTIFQRSKSLSHANKKIYLL